MDLSQGFQIEDPEVFVPWNVTMDELLEILPIRPRHVATTCGIDCMSLSGLKSTLWFHLLPVEDGRLREFSFIRSGHERESFDMIQTHLEATFGPPTSTSTGLRGYPEFKWTVGPARVSHYVVDGLQGPEHHTRITRPSLSF